MTTSSVVVTASEKKALNRAIFSIYLKFPFWGFILERCSIVFSNMLPTAGVTPLGKMYINPTFMSALSAPQLEFVLAHELQHLAMTHHARLRSRNLKLWNMATDYVINHDLLGIFVEAGFYNVMPTGALYDPNYAGMSAEEVYELLQKKHPEEPVDGDKDLIYTETGHADDTELRGARIPIEGTECEAGTRDWKNIALEAATSSKMYGKLPESIQREVLGNVKSKVDWNIVLRRHLQEIFSPAQREDASYSNYNRRQGAFFYRIPGPQYKRNKKPIIFAIDTSGSVDDTALAQALQELKTIQKTFDIDILMITCDAAVHETTWLKAGVWKTPKCSGGGGTDFVPIFTKIKELKMEDSLVLVYTDGYGNFGEAPKNKTLWLMTTTMTAPWGTTIKVRND